MLSFNTNYIHDCSDVSCIKKNDKVRSSRYILNKLIPRDATPELTEMIEFHKKNKWLEKYNIGVGGQK